jgi:ribonuclease VapC
VTIFIDASALIAVIAGEPGYVALEKCIEADAARLCSAVSVWETVAGLCRSHSTSVDIARGWMRVFGTEMRLRFVPIGEAEYEIAADAYARYGKGRHPAALNMGDCLAYACAKAANAKLLFKGTDFTRADIEPAVRP